MQDWKELFPIESIAPLIGGAIVWFGLNYLFLAPEVLGPRLAEKYYRPACLAAVATGRQGFQQEMQQARENGLAQIQRTMEEVTRQVAGQAQASIGTGLGALFGGRPGSERFMQRHGDTLNQWAGQAMAPALQQVLNQRLAQERGALDRQLQTRQREAEQGVIHRTPAPFCGCVVSEGLAEQIDLAAFTSTLRLYAPRVIQQLNNGSRIMATTSCGRPPFA